MHPKGSLSRKKIEAIANDPTIIDFSRIHKAGFLFQCLNHTLRQQILRIIKKMQPITVKDLQMRMLKDQSVVSQNLDILRQGNFLHRKKEGKYSYYSVNDEALQAALDRFDDELPTT